MKSLLSVAWSCALIPLATGLSIYLLWLATEWEWLVGAGIFTLFLGVTLFLIGCWALGSYFWRGIRDPSVPRRRLLMVTGTCAAALLLNFPVAGAISLAAIAQMARYTVTVFNSSQVPLRDVRLTGGGCDVSLGVVPSGKSAQQRLQFQQDGELMLSAKLGDEELSIEVEGYVEYGIGGSSTVIVETDGNVSVQHRGS